MLISDNINVLSGVVVILKACRLISSLAKELGGCNLHELVR